jgi:UDP-glucose 4-epimerase
MKVIVCGSSGFIGTNLVNALRKNKHKVITIDLINGADFIFDVASPKFVEYFKDELLEENISCIYHLASPCSVIQFNRDIAKCTKDSINGLNNVIELANFLNAKVILPSSGNVYGDVPYMQEDVTPKPNNPYAITKRAMEYILMGSMRNFTIFRIFCGYGPHETHKGDISSPITMFLRDIINNKKPIVWGDGNQNRDFVYIDDITKLMVDALEKNITGLYNLGTGESFSFNYMIATLAGMFNPKIRPQYISKPSSYVEKTKADTQKLLLKFGYIPESFPTRICDYASWIKAGNKP